MEHPAVMECAVTGVTDEARGQSIKATIKLAPGYEQNGHLKRDILRFMKKRTASYKQPRSIVFVDELPKTISGKIRRVELRR
jgi:acetyl-CoA synthetase